MSSSLNIETNKVIQIDNNDLKTEKKDEWEYCCKYIATLSVSIVVIFLVVYLYANKKKNF